MKTIKKTLATVMCIVMMLTAAPLSGFVGLDLPDFGSIFSTKAEAASLSGTCGENLTWTLDTSTGEFNINGTGVMNNWSNLSEVPWYSYSSYIKTVNFDNSVTSIGARAFDGCDSLENVTIPNSVTSIGARAFDGCDSLENVTIPNSVTSIGGSAFYFCHSLESVTIPNSVTSIGSSAFRYCKSLASITVDEANTAYSSDEYGALFNKDKTELIQYPIGNTRTSYTIPDSVTSIGGSAFYYCDSLESVTIPNSVTSIGDHAFYGCDSLENVTIPNSVTSIGGSAFHFCDSLASITIPDSVTSIGFSAFYGCDSLARVTIGNSVTSIGSSAFIACRSLASITVDEANTAYSSDEYGALFNKDKTELIQYPIGNTRTSYTIPDSVTSIGDGAFEYCRSLASVTIGNSVTSIGVDAFYGCHGLENVTIPNSVTSIGYSAFHFCDSLKDVFYSGSKNEWSEIDISIYYNFSLKNARIHLNYDPDNHIAISVIAAPTCTEKGYTEFTCVCGYTYYGDYVDKIGHNYTSLVTAPTCEDKGYTTYTCECGENYIDDYVDATGHTAGEWAVTKPATSTQSGTKTQSCTVCGTVLNTQIIPAYGKVNSVSVSNVSLDYKSSTTLNPQISIDAGVKYTVSYSSSNPSVASVDANGKISTGKTGSATITVTVTDEYGNTVSDTCNVEVKYNWWQWILVIVLFGWIWY